MLVHLNGVLSFLGSDFSSVGDRYATMAAHLCVSASVSPPPWSEAAISNESTDPWHLEDRALFVHLSSAAYFRNKYMAACPLSYVQKLAEIYFI